MTRSPFACVVMGIAIAMGTLGCWKSSSSQAKSSGSSADKASAGESRPEQAGSTVSASVRSSGANQQAQEAVMAEVRRHWVKGPDGWTTARISGSAYAPDYYLRQLRDISVEGVETEDLDDSDRLNGIEWAGRVSFKSAPCREAGDPGIILEGISDSRVNRQKGRWTQWVNFQPDPIRLLKVKGQWQINPDTWMLRGNLPRPEDFARAGMR